MIPCAKNALSYRDFCGERSGVALRHSIVPKSYLGVRFEMRGRHQEHQCSMLSVSSECSTGWWGVSCHVFDFTCERETASRDLLSVRAWCTFFTVVGVVFDTS